ncbi:MAG: hypothetical protein AB2A00_11615 [Myxococcota bacterium]
MSSLPCIAVTFLLAATTPPATTSTEPPPPAPPDPAAASAWLERALGFRLKPTGFLVVNTVVNSGAPAPTQEAPFAAGPGARPLGATGATPFSNGATFTITPRQSRVGAEVSLQLTPLIRGTAVGELDFFGIYLPGGPPGVTQVAPRLRLAYLQVGTERLKLQAGQALSVVAARYPTSLNHLAVPAFTQAGFAWNRLPQLTLLTDLPFPSMPAVLGGPKFVGALSLVRPHSGDHEGTAPALFDTVDPGARGLLPFLQARGALESKHLALGVVGHAGVESYNITHPDGTVRTFKQLPSYLVGVDGRVSALGFSAIGSLWGGANVNTLFAMSGVRRYALLDDKGAPLPNTLRDVETLRAVGGFLQLTGPIWPGKVEWVAGLGAEQTVDEDKVALGERVFNAALQLGVLFPLHKHLDAGVEYYHVVSRYKLAAGMTNAQLDNVAAAVRLKL